MIYGILIRETNRVLIRSYEIPLSVTGDTKRQLNLLKDSYVLLIKDNSLLFTDDLSFVKSIRELVNFPDNKTTSFVRRDQIELIRLIIEKYNIENENKSLSLLNNLMS